VTIIKCGIGALKTALGVLAGIMKEYLYNVGWIIKFLTNKYAQMMTAEARIARSMDFIFSF
jgi:hypothetical protein